MKFSKQILVALFSSCISLAALSQESSGPLPLPLPDPPRAPEPRPRPRPPAPTPPPPEERVPAEPEYIAYSFGVTDLGAYGSKAYQFMLHPSIGQLVEIKLLGTEDNVDIKEVRIYSSNVYLVRNVSSLAGNLRYGEIKTAKLEGAMISRIEIVASASSFWKRPGSFRLDITTMKNR
ncbi:hypothetical protein BDW_04240 [Bdellovibrio bacteriovorus W]|nr:hypothetical protein BDW_04240 [Bdellovibrio bacteriovorus W]